MINPFKEVNWNPDLAGRKQFAKSLIIGFPILALVWMIIGRLAKGEWPVEMALWVGGVGCCLGILFWILPSLAKPFYVVWYGVACSIGLVISNVLLVTFYLTVVTLFGFLRRTLGKTGLDKGFNSFAKTYWKDAEKVTDSKRYYSQY